MQSNPQEGSARPIHILHLEDSAVDAELVRERLTETGMAFEIERVSNGSRFETAVRAGGFDLIISDYALPDYDGTRALALARQVAPETPFIFVSGVLGEDIAVESLKRGAIDYVGKQRLQRLPTAVTRALEETRRRAAHRATQEALKASEARLRFALEAGRLGSWDLSLDTMELTTSDICKANFGQAEDASFTYDDLLAAIHPADRPLQQDAVQTALQSGVLDVEYRAIWPDGRVRWIHVRGRTARDTEGRPIRMTGLSLDVTDRKDSDERQRLLMAELDHRAKNMLAVVQAMVRLSRAGSPAEMAEAIEGRIAALARAHTLLARSRWDGADLRTLIEEEMAPYQGAVEIKGPVLRLIPEAAQAIAMVVHEMATNAVKHGALSRPQGRILIAWRETRDNGDVHLDWLESGGPAIQAPTRTGVGSMVIRQSIEHQLSGTVEMDWRPAGLVVAVRIPAPLATRAGAGRGPATLADREGDEGGTLLGGRRILVVEDSGVQAEELRQLLGVLGCQVEGPVASVTEGLALARTVELDAAVLDIDLRGEKSFAVAKALAERGVPFIFSTGYGRAAALDGHFDATEVVAKPFETDLLRLALIRALKRGAHPAGRTLQ